MDVGKCATATNLHDSIHLRCLLLDASGDEEVFGEQETDSRLSPKAKTSRERTRAFLRCPRLVQCPWGEGGRRGRKDGERGKNTVLVASSFIYKGSMVHRC